MIEIIDTEEVVEDGVTYIIEHYSNGGTVKYPKPPENPQPDPMANAISEAEQVQLEMQTNVEYLVEIAEMNMEV